MEMFGKFKYWLLIVYQKNNGEQAKSQQKS